MDPFQIVERFVNKIRTRKDDVFVGIDPGATGAIAFFCSKSYAVVDIPTFEIETGRKKRTTAKEFARTGKRTKMIMSTAFDHAGICKIFRLLKDVKERVVVVLEEVPTSLGPGKHHAEILLNRAYAMWPLYLHSKGYIKEEVRPNVWKKAMGLTSDKERSRRKALSLFPKADILRKQDHDRAEALLLIEYIRRTRGGRR